MAEEFEDRDLSGSVFWGVDLKGATFRDADLSGSTFFHTLWSGVGIDGVVDGLVVNGVDVTDFVNAHDRWYPLRMQLEPSTAGGVREAWAVLCDEWRVLLGKVDSAAPGVADRSVNGEWSLRDTLRHLVFAMDKWFVVPVLGDEAFSEIGLPNTGSLGREWPGIDMSSAPGFEDVLAVRQAQHARFGDFIAGLDFADLPATVEVPENGTVPAHMCFHVVLEEEFEHLRYMVRDLAALGIV